MLITDIAILRMQWNSLMTCKKTCLACSIDSDCALSHIWYVARTCMRDEIINIAISTRQHPVGFSVGAFHGIFSSDVNVAGVALAT